MVQTANVQRTHAAAAANSAGATFVSTGGDAGSRYSAVKHVRKNSTVVPNLESVDPITPRRDVSS
jgi:hypothetical protein